MKNVHWAPTCLFLSCNWATHTSIIQLPIVLMLTQDMEVPNFIFKSVQNAFLMPTTCITASCKRFMIGQVWNSYNNHKHHFLSRKERYMWSNIHEAKIFMIENANSVVWEATPTFFYDYKIFRKLANVQYSFNNFLLCILLLYKCEL